MNDPLAQGVKWPNQLNALLTLVPSSYSPCLYHSPGMFPNSSCPVTSEPRISWRNRYRIQKIPAWLLRRLQNAEEVQSNNERIKCISECISLCTNNVNQPSSPYHCNIVITGSSLPTNAGRFSDSIEDFPSGKQADFSPSVRRQFRGGLPGDMDSDLYQACLDTMILPHCSVVLEMERNSHMVKTKKKQVFQPQRLYHLPFQGHCRGKRHLQKSVQGKNEYHSQKNHFPLTILFWEWRQRGRVV